MDFREATEMLGVTDDKEARKFLTKYFHSLASGNFQEWEGKIERLPGNAIAENFMKELLEF